VVSPIRSLTCIHSEYPAVSQHLIWQQVKTLTDPFKRFNAGVYPQTGRHAVSSAPASNSEQLLRSHVHQVSPQFDPTFCLHLGLHLLSPTDTDTRGLCSCLNELHRFSILTLITQNSVLIFTLTQIVRIVAVLSYFVLGDFKTKVKNKL